MIVRICQDQPSVHIGISTQQCQSLRLVDYDHIRLVISSLRCKKPTLSTLIWRGCWIGKETPYIQYADEYKPKVLVYPASGIDKEGAIIFTFSDFLFSLPPGRYRGHIEVDGKKFIEHFDIELCSAPYIIDKITQPDLDRGC